MADESPDELLEMRCRCCGVFMGHRRRIGRFVFWCSEDCADSVMAKWEESQPRDEMICAMYLDNRGIMEISRFLEWPYQYVQQTLARRGLQEWLVKEHTRLDKNGQAHIVKEHKVLMRNPG
jgi:hypothetical protein